MKTMKKMLAAVLILAISNPAFANPSITSADPGVSVTFPSAGVMTIDTTGAGARSLANFSTFNINVGETLNINQSGAGSAFLARINDVAPSSILGTMNSNGKVYLVNPNGFIFGGSSVINVNSLVAATSNISDLDFRNGVDSFVAGATFGAITVNAGAQISAGAGGFLALVGSVINNSGTLRAPNGAISLVTNHDVGFDGAMKPVVNVDARDTGGTYTDSSGNSVTGAITAGGTIQASTAVIENGKIFLRSHAPGQVVLNGTLAAGSGAGSEIDVAGGRITQSAGSLSAETVKLQATALGGISQTGGMIKATHLDVTADVDNVSLDSATNLISNLAQGYAGAAFSLKNGQDMNVTGPVEAAGGNARIFLTAGDLVLGVGSSITSSVDIILATPDVFVNNAGAGVLTLGGDFYIYSNDVTADTKGGLAGLNLYGRTFTGHEPYGADMNLFTGNRFIHIVSPTLTVTADSYTKVYGEADPAMGGYTYSGLVGGDAIGNVLTGSLAAREAGEHVGLGSCAGGGYCIGQGTLADRVGYTLSFTGGKLDITARDLTIAAVSETKVYDGSTFSNLAPTTVAGAGVGLVGADTVSGTQEFASKNVLGANASSLAVTAYTVTDGNGGANYNVTLQGATGSITPASLTIAAVSDSKVYDANTGSSGTPGVAGILGTDTVTGLSQSFASDNVLGLNGSTLTVSSYAINDGNGGANYALTLSNAAGTITPAPLTITALTDTKIYDATTVSLVNPNVTGLVGADTVSGVIQSFDSANVQGANGSTLSVTGYTINDGNGGSNYSIVFNSAGGTITPRLLQIAATADSKVYDGTTSSSATPVVTGLAGSDNVTGLSQAFTAADVSGAGGTPIAVTSYTLNDGNGGANYTVTTAQATGSIVAASASAAGADSALSGSIQVMNEMITTLGIATDSSLPGDGEQGSIDEPVDDQIFKLAANQCGA